MPTHRKQIARDYVVEQGFFFSEKRKKAKKMKVVIPEKVSLNPKPTKKAKKELRRGLSLRF